VSERRDERLREEPGSVSDDRLREEPGPRAPERRLRSRLRPALQGSEADANRAGSVRAPDAVWIAWLVAAAVLVVLTVNVVRHLSAPRHMHVPASDTLFRDGAAPLGPLLSHRLLTAWHVDAVALAVIVLAGAWYATALNRRQRRTDGPWPIGRTAAFAAGLAVCAYATCGAIAVYDKALFSAHMLGHLALLMLAPALLVAGCPVRLAVEAATPPTARRIERIGTGPVVSLLTSPPVALACYTGVIVGSHLTGLMDTIMTSTVAGQLEHLVYLLVGYQFFVLILGDEPIRWRLSTPARWGLLALSMAVDTFTGVTLMMATAPVAMHPPAGLNVDPLADTHTGGSIMWFGGDAIMAAVMTLLVVGWLRTSGRSLRDRSSWLEQARSATLSEHTGSGGDLDDDDARLDAYNKWLAAMADEDGRKARS
jgi:cytochrome c oxidase assembly factor CtaG